MLTRSNSEWMRHRSAVWISDKFGLAARTEDGRWFAYPFGGTELGPFASLDEAKLCLERRGEDGQDRMTAASRR